MLNKLGLACAIAVIGVGTAAASTVTFTTASGATESGGNAVSATAVVTTNNGSITVVLTNNIVNPTTVAQNISDFFFTLGSSPGTLGSETVSGSLINIAANGTVSAASGTPSGWTLSANGNIIHLDDLGAGAPGPEQTIIGAPGAGGVYTNANGSIAGNDPHNPFISQTATFTIAASSVTSATTITAATFSFGTVSGNDVPGTPQGNPTPEPGSLFLTLAGAGLVAVGMVRGKFAKKA